MRKEGKGQTDFFSKKKMCGRDVTESSCIRNIENKTGRSLPPELHLRTEDQCKSHSIQPFSHPGPRTQASYSPEISRFLDGPSPGRRFYGEVTPYLTSPKAYAPTVYSSNAQHETI